MTTCLYPVIAGQTDLPFYISGIGISDPEYHVTRKTGLVSHQFLFTKSGSGNFIIKGHSYLQKPGSIIYLSPGIPHEYYPIDDDWVTQWIVFRGKELSSLMQTMGFPTWTCTSCIPSELPVHLFNRIFAAAKDPVDANEKCSELVYEYILTMRKLLISSPKTVTGTGSIVESAVSYINSNFEKQMTLEELSSLSDVSLQHFCRVFKAKMNMRPLEYIARRRISEAKKLLSNTAHSVAHIGELVGYEDPTYFGIVFKKYEGISPSEYRLSRNTLSI